MKWRFIHIGDKKWKYKVHDYLVEIRTPENKKLLVEREDFLPNFSERFDLAEEYCFNRAISLDEYNEWVAYFNLMKEREDG